jgi:hypothetical protein
LEGASNFIPWKFKLQMLLEEVEILEHVVKEIPTPTSSTWLIVHVKREAKAKKISCDSMKDHLIPHVVVKTMDKEM